MTELGIIGIGGALEIPRFGRSSAILIVSERTIHERHPRASMLPRCQSILRAASPGTCVRASR